MIIDVNAFLGHYPFRSLQSKTAASLVEQMDAHGIDVALVSSLHAIFYRDTHQGNLELFEEIAPYPTRLFPIATINPRYIGWEKDLRTSIEQGAKGIALYPEHHGYRLNDAQGNAALAMIDEYAVPVVLTQRLEDRRQRHHWDVANDLALPAVIQAATAHRNLRFFFNNWIGLNPAQLVAAELRGRCLIDIARLHVLHHKDVPKLIDALHIESIAFGTHAPFDYLGPALVKLANIHALFPEDYDKISYGNAAAFFRLNVPIL